METLLEALNESQEELGLRSGNRLTKNHIQYGKHKMKVLFAAQLFSGSSATSMDDYRMDQFDESIPDLKDSETTSFFCRTIDQLFDFCNSRSPLATG